MICEDLRIIYKHLNLRLNFSIGAKFQAKGFLDMKGACNKKGQLASRITYLYVKESKFSTCEQNQMPIALVPELFNKNWLNKPKKKKSKFL